MLVIHALTEFAAHLGVQAPLGADGPDYSDDLVFTGFVRHGVSDQLTLGGNLQLDEHSAMGGVEAVFGTQIGTFASNLSLSHVDNVGEGWAATVSFQRLFQRLALGELVGEIDRDQFAVVVGAENVAFFATTRNDSNDDSNGNAN